MCKVVWLNSSVFELESVISKRQPHSDQMYKTEMLIIFKAGIQILWFMIFVKCSFRTIVKKKKKHSIKTVNQRKYCKEILLTKGISILPSNIYYLTASEWSNKSIEPQLHKNKYFIPRLSDNVRRWLVSRAGSRIPLYWFNKEGCGFSDMRPEALLDR